MRAVCGTVAARVMRGPPSKTYWLRGPLIRTMAMRDP